MNFRIDREWKILMRNDRTYLFFAIYYISSLFRWQSIGEIIIRKFIFYNYSQNIQIYIYLILIVSLWRWYNKNLCTNDKSLYWKFSNETKEIFILETNVLPFNRQTHSQPKIWQSVYLPHRLYSRCKNHCTLNSYRSIQHSVPSIR